MYPFVNNDGHHISYSGHSTGGGVDREIYLSVKHGVEAKNYEDVSVL